MTDRYAVFGKLAARAKWIKSQTLKVGDAKADCEVVEIDLGKSKHTVWIDRERQLVIALLTNRVHPTRDNALVRVWRPRIHNTVLRTLGF